MSKSVFVTSHFWPLSNPVINPSQILYGKGYTQYESNSNKSLLLRASGSIFQTELSWKKTERECERETQEG